MAAKPTRQQHQVAELLRAFEPKIEKAFRDAISKSAGAIDLKKLIAALELGDVEHAVRLFRLEQGVFFPLSDALRSSFMAGGALTGSGLPMGVSASFGFDGRHVRAEAWAARHAGYLITTVLDDIMHMARDVILDGLREGRGSAKVARDLMGRKVGRVRVGGFLGLNGPQTDDVIRARQILSDPKQIRKYFIKDRKTGRMKPRFELSDRRFDRQILKAIREGRGISGDKLDQIIEGHKSKALLHRGKVIAKQEAHTALAAGREEGFQQLLDGGNVESVSVRWQHNLSQEPRDDHVAMSGTVIQFGQTFNFADASMKHPHDPAGGAKHSLGCRCIAVYRVKVAKNG